MKTDWQNVHSKVQEKRKKVTFNTMQIIAFGFLGVIFLGSILLYLPISNQEPIAYLDALFVSVSAVCVTGLVTVFPAAQFTLFGKVVLLGLIQIGGLGVIACTMAVFLAIRKKITMKSRVMIQQTYNLETLSGMVRFIIRILKGTVLVEGIGAVLFAFHFVPEYGFIKGVAYGIFHSVSAFCNAGIDVLGTSSFMEYVSSPLVSDGVRSAESPTVPIAEVASYIKSINRSSGSKTASPNRPVSQIANVRNTIAIPERTLDSASRLPKHSVDFLPRITAAQVSSKMAIVVVLIPPAVPPGEPPINIRIHPNNLDAEVSSA